MSDLSQEEKVRYDWLSEEAKRGRELKPQEVVEWQAFGQRYARQLERERVVYLERRDKDMKEFLAEKRAWADARDKAREAGEEFAAPEPIREFTEWLKAKGRL